MFYFSYLQITSGEYIQMSGRAGRRGIDDRGIVILIVDEKMGPDVGKELLKVLLYIGVFFFLSNHLYMYYMLTVNYFNRLSLKH